MHKINCRMAVLAVPLLLMFAALAAEEEPELRVPESGVGAGVENRALTDPADRFAVGDQVWFWNRVTGGAAGGRIHHVWLREGREHLSIGLSLGGAHWRTWSRKTMHPGSEGEWTVEARDDQGRVLASARFTCVAAGE